MGTKKDTMRWTIVQHSGYGYGGKPGFRHALETRSVPTKAEQTKVIKAGGLLFDSYGAAEDYADERNLDGPGLYPNVPGTFSRVEVDGLAVYIPPRPAPCQVPGCGRGENHEEPHEAVRL